jgi:hypothetical protein
MSKVEKYQSILEIYFAVLKFYPTVSKNYVSILVRIRHELKKSLTGDEKS